MKQIDRFERYGFVLSRLKESEIELLRSWRNEPEIAKQMKAQAGRQISKEEQKAWFDSIKNRDDAFYFLYYLGDLPTGYACIKNINWQEGSGEPGGFSYYSIKTEFFDNIANPKGVLLGTCLMFDLYFEVLGLKKLNIEVKSSNKKALRFNKLLGYKRESERNDGEFLAFSLSKDDYFKKRDEILKIINK